MDGSEKIDVHIKALPEWQQQICNKTRRLIHQAIPLIKEEIKFTNRPYFTYKGNVCALLTAKDHVNLFIHDPLVSDPDGIINQGKTNTTACSIQIEKGTFPNEASLVALLKEVADHNDKGGWRTLR